MSDCAPVSSQSSNNMEQNMQQESDPDLAQVKKALEAVLLASPEPVAVSELRKMFDTPIATETLHKVLEELRAEWQGRGVELINVASGWRFCTRPEYQKFLDRLNPQKPPRYSRAVMETLAIVAYRQPVTRGDIEDIRGVTVSSNIIKTLELRGWIDVVGNREVAGRPALYATTKSFLDDLNLRSLEELPPLEELGTLVEHADTVPAPESAADRAIPAVLESEAASAAPTAQLH